MNWCQEHWDKLKQVIDDKGMTQFIPDSGEEAVTNMKKEIEGEDVPFDPLMGSYWRINNKMAESLRDLGREDEILQLKCPLCILVEDGQPETAADWINGVTDEAQMYAVDQGLITKQ